MGQEQNDHQNDSCSQRTRKRCLCTATFVNERLRHAAADRKTAADSCGQIGSGKRQKLLIGVEPSAVLRREHAADGRGFHRPEQEARECQGKKFI